jgi:hypothetical protein
MRVLLRNGGRKRGRLEAGIKPDREGGAARWPEPVRARWLGRVWNETAGTDDTGGRGACGGSAVVCSWCAAAQRRKCDNPLPRCEGSSGATGVAGWRGGGVGWVVGGWAFGCCRLAGDVGGMGRAVDGWAGIRVLGWDRVRAAAAAAIPRLETAAGERVRSLPFPPEQHRHPARRVPALTVPPPPLPIQHHAGQHRGCGQEGRIASGPEPAARPPILPPRLLFDHWSNTGQTLVHKHWSNLGQTLVKGGLLPALAQLWAHTRRHAMASNPTGKARACAARACAARAWAAGASGRARIEGLCGEDVGCERVRPVRVSGKGVRTGAS